MPQLDQWFTLPVIYDRNTNAKPPSRLCGQTLDAQLEQLRGAGCTKVFREKLTDAHSDRRQLLKMLDTLAPRDVVIVTRIDRLALSAVDLFAIASRSSTPKRNSVHWPSRGPNTETNTGRLMISVLGGLADLEGDLSRTRTAEGRSRAQKCGSIFETDGSAAGRSTAAARAGCNIGGTRAQLGVGKSNSRL